MLRHCAAIYYDLTLQEILLYRGFNDSDEAGNRFTVIIVNELLDYLVVVLRLLRMH